MSEEQTNVAQETATETPKQETQATAQTNTAETKSNVFTQEQLDNIIKARLEAEQRKYEKKLQEEEKQKAEILKQKQLEEAKTKQDLEKIMQERLSEKKKNLILSKNKLRKKKLIIQYFL